MPLSDAERSALPADLRHFTNRDEQLDAFERLWQESRPILAFEGMSGNGKSTLIRVLIEAYCKPRQIPYALIDFDDPSGSQFRQSADDLCRAIIMNHTLGLPVFATQEFKFSSSEALARLAERKAEFNISQRMTSGEGGAISHSDQTMQLDLGEIFARFERQARAEIGQAALDALQYHADHECIIFLDTMERLMAEADPHHRDWFWGWLIQAGQRYPKLRLVIGGRQPLKLDRGQGQELTLGDLSREDSADLLGRMGVTDPAWRTTVYERLAGGHPLITELAGELWTKLEPDTLPVDEIPRLAGHEKAVDWLTGKILERLEEPLASAVRWAALLRRFTRPTLQATLPPDLPELTPALFDQLRTFSFVEPADPLGGSYTCHDLLRRVQSQYLSQHEPDEFQRFHQRAANHFAEAGEKMERLYHGLAAGDETTLTEWEQAVYQARDTWDWPTWGALLDVAGSPELSSPPGWQGSILEKRGWWRYRRGDRDLALETYQQAIKLLTAAGDQAALGYTYNNIGEIHRSRGDYERALHFYDQSLAITEKLGDQAGLATSCLNIGSIYYARGDYTVALIFFQKSLEIEEKLSDYAGLATTYNNIGTIHRTRGDYDQALYFYQKDLEISEKLGDQVGLAPTYNNMGNIHKTRGDYDQALYFYQKSLAITEELGDQTSMATTYNNIGEIHRARGDYDQALHFYQKDLEISEKLGDQVGLATTYNNTALVYLARGDLAQAIAYFEKSLAILEEIGAAANAAAVRENLAAARAAAQEQ